MENSVCILLLFTNAQCFLGYSPLYVCLFKVEEKPNLWVFFHALWFCLLLNSSFPPALQSPAWHETTALAFCSPEGGHSFIFLTIYQRPFENFRRLLSVLLYLLFFWSLKNSKVLMKCSSLEKLCHIIIYVCLSLIILKRSTSCSLLQYVKRIFKEITLWLAVGCTEWKINLGDVERMWSRKYLGKWNFFVVQSFSDFWSTSALPLCSWLALNTWVRLSLPLLMLCLWIKLQSGRKSWDGPHSENKWAPSPPPQQIKIKQKNPPRTPNTSSNQF